MPAQSLLSTNVIVIVILFLNQRKSERFLAAPALLVGCCRCMEEGYPPLPRRAIRLPTCLVGGPPIWAEGTPRTAVTLRPSGWASSWATVGDPEGMLLVLRCHCPEKSDYCSSARLAVLARPQCISPLCFSNPDGCRLRLAKTIL